MQQKIVASLPTRYQLQRLLKPIDLAPVECDGAAHLIARELRSRQIDFIVKQGSCTFRSKIILPHFWVEVGEWMIDYRLKMWLGCSPQIPHGVFPSNRYSQIKYEGVEYNLPVLPEAVYEVMMIGSARDPKWKEEFEMLRLSAIQKLGEKLVTAEPTRPSAKPSKWRITQ